jgi:hypothetical protein
MGKFIGMNTVAGRPAIACAWTTTCPTPHERASRPVVEFRNTILNHYFMTIDPQNVADILAGATGRAGSSRASRSRGGRGDAFYAPMSCAASTAATARRPNSHFYTAVADECDKVRAASTGRGATRAPASTAGAARGSVSRGLRREPRVQQPLVGQRLEPPLQHQRFDDRDLEGEGWSYEGIVMCTPP